MAASHAGKGRAVHPTHSEPRFCSGPEGQTDYSPDMDLAFILRRPLVRPTYRKLHDAEGPAVRTHGFGRLGEEPAAVDRRATE
jgi:hypothetical protein